MPSHRCDKGGWKHLRQALMELNAPCIRKGGRIDIATGHFGQIQPPFLANMCTLLKNNTNHEEEDDGLISKGDGWNNPLTKSKIGMAFLYFCSRSTVLAKNTNSFAVLRTTAPGTSSTTNSTRIGTHSEILDKYFYDAKPKFIPMTTTQKLENKTHAEHPMLLPILHGKAMLAVSEAEDAATMFVGSQNFSAAGWGEQNRQPTNVELGVVLCVHGQQAVLDLIHRFPVKRAHSDSFGTSAIERDYIMSRGPTNSDNSAQGLQMRWRRRCNDLNSLNEWRCFLSHFWRICQRCNMRQDHVSKGTTGGTNAMEHKASQGVSFLCEECDEE
jgi:hypothetical protein